MSTRQPRTGSSLYAEAFEQTGTPAPLDQAARPTCPGLPGSGTVRRILLLTSGLGSGHARAAEAIKRAWHAVDPQATVHTLDFWSLMDSGVADTVQQSYLRLVIEHPDLYERVYHSISAHGARSWPGARCRSRCGWC